VGGVCGEGRRWADGLYVGWFVVAGERQSRVKCGLNLGLIESELSGSMGRVFVIRKSLLYTSFAMWGESVKK
jgi:hypothetical protein